MCFPSPLVSSSIASFFIHICVQLITCSRPLEGTVIYQNGMMINFINLQPQVLDSYGANAILCGIKFLSPFHECREVRIDFRISPLWINNKHGSREGEQEKWESSAVFVAETDFLGVDEDYQTLKDGRRKGQQKDIHEWRFVGGDWKRNGCVEDGDERHHNFIWFVLSMTPGVEMRNPPKLMTICAQDRGEKEIKEMERKKERSERLYFRPFHTLTSL